MVREAETMGDPSTWETARELGKQLIIPVGPYEPRVPTAEEFNAVLPYLLNRATTFYRPRYFCENAELALAHLLGMNVPRQGFPEASGFSRHGLDWEGYDENGYNREGFDRKGYDRNGRDKHGFDKDGYDYYGFDRDGYNVRGRDRNGRTREEAVTALISGWSDEFAAIIAAEIAKQLPAEPAPEPASQPVKKATKAAAARTRAAAVKRAAPAKKTVAKKATVAA